MGASSGCMGASVGFLETSRGCMGHGSYWMLYEGCMRDSGGQIKAMYQIVM